MNQLYKRTFKTIAIVGTFVLASCSSDDNEPIVTDVEVVVENTVEGHPLKLTDTTYISPSGDIYAVQELAYFMSNIKLLNANGEAAFIEPDSYHLIDEKVGKHAFMLTNVKAGTYTKLQFGVGVDAARNHSTDQYGDLDPSSAMVWDWDTGYKFFSLVGTYTADTKSDGLVFHIGGDANYKTVTIDLQQPLVVKAATGNRITIVTDLNALFQAPNLIDFDQINTAMTGPDAAKIAENYSTGFFKLVTAE